MQGKRGSNCVFGFYCCVLKCGRQQRLEIDVLLACDQSVQLLTTRQVFSAAGREAVEAELRDAYGVGRVDFDGDGVFAQSGKVVLQDAGLCFSRYDSRISIEFPGLNGFAQALCLSGTGRVVTALGSVDLTPDVSCIIPPHTPFRAEYGDGYRHLVLQFDPDSLAERAEATTGSASLSLPLMTPLATDSQRRLRSLATVLAEQFNEDAAEDDLAITELSRAVATSFLQTHLEDFAAVTSGGGQRAWSAESSLLEDYIDAHWNEPLSIEDIAEACGVSVRSVYARFKQKRGLSPAGYLRDVRLRNARNLLMAPSGGSVIDVAMKCGFASFGHFARRYREKFGELPSATLARRR